MISELNFVLTNIWSQERQAAYNKTFGDGGGQNKDTVLEKLVLDFDPETKKVLVEVNPKLVKKLKPHQVQYSTNGLLQLMQIFRPTESDSCGTRSLRALLSSRQERSQV